MATATVTGRLSTSQPAGSGIYFKTMSLDSNGNAASSGTFAHGLGVIPDFAIVYHMSSGNDSRSAPQVVCAFDSANCSVTNFGNGQSPICAVGVVSAWSPVR